MRTLSASRQHQPLVYQLKIGAVKVTVIAESVAPLLRWQELYPDATERSVSASVATSDPGLYDVGSGRLVIAIQGFVIESDGTTLMVDTCVGDCKARARPEFNDARFGWLGRLQATGIRVEDVDLVLSTHLHVDHVGCNTDYADGRWRPTFPNARYLFVNDEFEFWSSELARSPLERTGDYIGDSVFINHKSYINLRRSLGNHVDVGVRNGAEHLGRNPRRALDVLTHQAHDGFAALIFHVG